MNTKTTKGIQVMVESQYEPNQSEPLKKRFFFVYRITITNNSDSTVQLLRRRWRIIDSQLKVRTVEGAGVIGEQPILAPGESHQYTSFCPMQTDIGQMSGSYLMLNLDSSQTMNVAIPAFCLVASPRLN